MFLKNHHRPKIRVVKDIFLLTFYFNTEYSIIHKKAHNIYQKKLTINMKNIYVTEN